TKNIANKHREFLDSEARLYFTEQGFDNFYVGKGSTYPQVNGSLGILFEAGAARGGKIETVNGIKTYADNIRTQFRTTLTTVAGALEQAEELHDFQARYFRSALELAAEDDRKAFVFTTHGDTARLHRFVDVLRQHDVTVHELGDDLTADDIEFTEGQAFVVPMAQRQYRMVRGIFDRLTEFEENVFYDVSGWTLPLAYDLDYAALDEETFSTDLLGDEIENAPALADVPSPSRARYGYVFDWSEYYAPRALYRLLSEDVLVRIAEEPFEIRAGQDIISFDRGAVFVPLIRQDVPDSQIHSIMKEIAEKDGIRVTAATSGAAEVATDAVGGRSFSAVTEPEILLLIDDGLARYDAGEMWHLLDFVMEMPVTIRRKNSLGSLDWSRYTHLIMVGGGNPDLSKSTTERVTRWISEEGGTLIALRQSAHWAQETMLQETEDSNKDEDDKDEEDEPQRFDYSEMGLRDAEHVIGGTIVASDLDISHPLGFGYKDRFLPVHRNTEEVLDWPEENPYAVVAAYPEENLVLSGYASTRRVEEISGTPSIIAERKGAGSVILMADNPVFRGTFIGTNKLVLNAIFFSSMINRPFGDYEDQGHVH
ncbi:MAG: peptidase, partial [Pseudomonadota bacterium]